VKVEPAPGPLNLLLRGPDLPELLERRLRARGRPMISSGSLRPALESGTMLSRRHVLASALGLLGGSVVGVRAADKIPRLGVLFVGARSDAEVKRVTDAFVQGLQEAGYADGRVHIEYRWAAGDRARLRDLAIDLVRHNVDVIVALSAPTADASKRATQTIPIVMVATDPVALGFTSNMARPAGNITGLSMMGVELVAKQLELLKETSPKISRAGILGNRANPGNASQFRQAQAAARSLGVGLQYYEASDGSEVDKALTAMSRDHAEALLVLADPVLTSHRERIARLSAQSRLPTMGGIRSLAEAGGLMTYSANYFDLCRRAAVYVDKILKGANPADLPIEQAATFELVINLKTAKALGLTIPQSILVRADQIIQ